MGGVTNSITRVSRAVAGAVFSGTEMNIIVAKIVELNSVALCGRNFQVFSNGFSTLRDRVNVYRGYP